MQTAVLDQLVSFKLVCAHLLVWIMFPKAEANPGLEAAKIMTEIETEIATETETKIATETETEIVIVIVAALQEVATIVIVIVTATATVTEIVIPGVHLGAATTVIVTPDPPEIDIKRKNKICCVVAAMRTRKEDRRTTELIL